MPPIPVFTKYFRSGVDNQSATEAGVTSTTPQQRSGPQPTPIKAESSVNPSVHGSTPSNATWISVKGKHKRTANGTDSGSRRRPNQQHLSGSETQPTEEAELNIYLCEKFKAGSYHRRDQRDPASEAAATLKQYHNDAIRQYCDPRPTEVKPPASWVTCGEIPTSNEIMDITEQWQETDPHDNSIVMRGNKLIGSWESKDAYLGAHFEMLREDASRPLREAVRWVRNFPEAGEDREAGGNIGIYSKGSCLQLCTN